MNCVVNAMADINCFDVDFMGVIQCAENDELHVDYLHSLTRRFFMRRCEASSHVYPYCFDIDIVIATDNFSCGDALASSHVYPYCFDIDIVRAPDDFS